MFVVFVGTSLMDIVWRAKFGFSYTVFRIAIIGWGLVLIPQYLPNKNIIMLGKVVSYSWLIVFLLMSIRAVMIYNEM